jgi:hypothetical protein
METEKLSKEVGRLTNTTPLPLAANPRAVPSSSDAQGKKENKPGES